MPRTTTTTRTSTNRQLDETSTTRQLDNKHEQKWQGHHNSENQLLWALNLKDVKHLHVDIQ